MTYVITVIEYGALRSVGVYSTKEKAEAALVSQVAESSPSQTIEDREWHTKPDAFQVAMRLLAANDWDVGLDVVDVDDAMMEL